MPDWIPRGSALRSDAVAGLSTAVLLVPQAMAYALLAGLPPVVGLYASLVPLVAYALAGTSRQLAVGPVAMDSLLTAATVGTIANSGSEQYVQLAATLALLVGILQAVLGLLRGGFVVNFLSRPVISGFTSGAALIIAASQVRLLVGLRLPASSSVVEIAVSVGEQLQSIHWPTAVLAGATLVTLWAMKRYVPRWPRALLVVVAGTAAVTLGGLQAAGVAVVGPVQAGLPAFEFVPWDQASVVALLPGALTIAVVGFLEGISVATRLAEQSGDQVNANRELLALGLANASAGLFGGYPVAGGFSRTAVNADAGATSRLAGAITAGAVALTLSFFTQVLHDLPKAVLGAIIVVAVGGLFDTVEPRKLWRINRRDLGLLIATFCATLFLGIQQGVLVGVVLSLAVLIARTTKPHTAVLGRLPGTEEYRNVARFADAQVHPGVLIVRLDSQLYFGNVRHLREQLESLERDSTTPLRAVILDASGINQLDSSAAHALQQLWQGYHCRGVRLILASAKGPVRDVLQRSGLAAQLGEKAMVLRVHDAVKQVA